MKLKPMGARIAIQYPKKEEVQNKPLIIIPNNEPVNHFAEIVATGELAHPLQIGDMVSTGRNYGHELELDGEKFIIIETQYIIARIERTNAN